MLIFILFIATKKPKTEEDVIMLLLIVITNNCCLTEHTFLMSLGKLDILLLTNKFVTTESHLQFTRDRSNCYDDL